MTIHKLTAGSGYTYLTRQVAANDATERGFGSLGDYYSAKGEAPGVWMGSGLATVPDFSPDAGVSEAQMLSLFGEGKHPNAVGIERLSTDNSIYAKNVYLGSPFRVFDQVNLFHRRAAGAYRDFNVQQGLPVDTPVPREMRAALRTKLATTMFVETFGRHPSDARELSGHLARISRQSTTAVSGYDLTFSPVKSVSTLWAVAPLSVARAIEHAHRDAVADTLRWIEQNATYTRRGRNGVAQVDVHGLLAAAFTHRDSRAGDPDLHTHVAISNKVQALDGAWLALDGRAIYRNGVAASERYNTRLEALLVDRLGVRFADRPASEPGKRPVREIVGVDGPLPRRWSSRRAAIDARRAQLSAAFQVDHGRPPTAQEAVALAQQANLETRQAKHEPRSYAEQRTAWHAEAISALGSERGLRDFVDGALTRHRDVANPTVDSRWVERTADTVLATVERDRATWQSHHIRAEAERQARAARVMAADLDRAVDAVVSAALGPSRSLRLGADSDVPKGVVVPTQLQRRDGSSIYTVAGSELYTSTRVLEAEQAIVMAAGRRDGRVVDQQTVNVVLSDGAIELNPGQVQLVRELVSSGARVQVALAPAGSGKTTAMQALAGAWRAGGGTVLGLAPSAAAAAVLCDAIDTRTDTLAKMIHSLDTGVDATDLPDRIDDSTLVLVDEAGMAGTVDLARTIDHVVARGGSVRLIGDDQQLAAIGAGGVLRDIAMTHGAATLSQVMRFTHPDTGAPNHAEGAASLALRDGDPAAIAFYTDNGRVHVGDTTTATTDAYTAWSNDRAAGRDAIMLAPTRELVAELNDRARRDRIAALTGPDGHEVQLVDGSRASAGDAIVTRKNDRRLAVTATDWVKNGDRWTVTAVHESGGLDVVHQRTGRRSRLPADYVVANVTLGYATTVHGAQGITADTGYTIVTGSESRQLLYVAMTRGRHANHVFLAGAGDGDPHSLVTRDALLPPTAVAILTRILARDTSPVSSTSAVRTTDDPATRLGDVADQYSDALGIAAVTYLGPARVQAIDAAAEAALPGLTGLDAYPGLRAHLALAAVQGHSPADLLREASNADQHRALGDARDAAAVLSWRLDPTGHHGAGTGPLPWLPAIPAALQNDPGWSRYLAHNATVIQSLASRVAEDARAWTRTSAPTWATLVTDRDPDLVAELAVWRAAHHIEDDDRRSTGQPMSAAADVRAQHRLDQRLHQVVGAPGFDTTRWADLAATIDGRILTDPYWPILAERFTVAARAGVDITARVRTAGSERPLPDEQPAAALWWRLAHRFAPAATVVHIPGSRALHPSWTSVLEDIVGKNAAIRIQADPTWPALVAAVTHAGRDGWRPAELLTTAHRQIQLTRVEPLRTDEMATALAWQIGTLADTAPPARQDYADQDCSFYAPIEPPDLHLLGESDAVLDDDWFSSLPEPQADISHSRPTSRRPRRDDEVAGVHADRGSLVNLNKQAAAFFAAHAGESWVPAYLAARFGSVFAERVLIERRFTVGYAPDGWTTLTTHLRRNGATDEDIVAAGLGVYASTGRVVDKFRDRVMTPVHGVGPDGQPEIHGWIGRRNPDEDATEKAVPKYLNTGATALFSKGRELYGLAENADLLAAGAVPVLVEGPFDALVVTLAGSGRYVGIAPMGTAFTDTQADLLRPYIGNGRAPIIVATDADQAGRRSAHRAFWRLVLRGDDPRYLRLDDGTDPAGLVGRSGAAALMTALQQTTSLADLVIADRMAPWAGRLDTVESKVLATRTAATVIVALPPETWPARIADVVASTGVGERTARNELLDAHTAWSTDPAAMTQMHLAERIPSDANSGHANFDPDHSPSGTASHRLVQSPSPTATRPTSNMGELRRRGSPAR